MQLTSGGLRGPERRMFIWYSGSCGSAHLEKLDISGAELCILDRMGDAESCWSKCFMYDFGKYIILFRKKYIYFFTSNLKMIHPLSECPHPQMISECSAMHQWTIILAAEDYLKTKIPSVKPLLKRMVSSVIYFLSFVISFTLSFCLPLPLFFGCLWFFGAW